jgi:teichuronic acid exporter
MAAWLCVWLVLEGFALWALVLSQIANAFVAMAVSVLAARWRPGRGVSATALRELRFFGLYAMGGRVLNQARLDQVLLGTSWAPRRWALLFRPAAFHDAGRHDLGRVRPGDLRPDGEPAGRDRKRRAAFGLAGFASAALAFPVFGGLVVLAPVVVPTVFGAQWSEAVFALQCFCVMGILAGVGIVQAALIRNLGRPDWWFWYQAMSRCAGLAVIAATAPLGLDAVMTGLVLVTLMPLALLGAAGLPDAVDVLHGLRGKLRGPAPRDAGHGRWRWRLRRRRAGLSHAFAPCPADRIGARLSMA